MTSVEAYQSSFTEHQAYVQKIAIEMLGSSYNLQRSNGFRSWLVKHEATSVPEPSSQDMSNQKENAKPVLTVKKARNPKPKPILQKLLTFLSETFEIGGLGFEGVTMFALTSLPTSGGVYWITSHSSILFMGTTSDLKKNIMLALKSVKKKTSDMELADSITKLIDENVGVSAQTMSIAYIECEDSKTRIRIKNRMKNETMFTPCLE